MVLLLALLCVIVVFQNTEQVQTQVLWVTVSMPRALLLFITALIGFIIGLSAALMFSRRRHKTGQLTRK
ncbi:MAG: LapA family protein [Candidatus Pacebacteria bacterium]|nr:LapA family protein [Candidatus Paceibacterota bacterium]